MYTVVIPVTILVCKFNPAYYQKDTLQLLSNHSCPNSVPDESGTALSVCRLDSRVQNTSPLVLQVQSCGKNRYKAENPMGPIYLVLQVLKAGLQKEQIFVWPNFGAWSFQNFKISLQF